jgi:hypothetical protein
MNIRIPKEKISRLLQTISKQSILQSILESGNSVDLITTAHENLPVSNLGIITIFEEVGDVSIFIQSSFGIEYTDNIKGLENLKWIFLIECDDDIRDIEFGGNFLRADLGFTNEQWGVLEKNFSKIYGIHTRLKQLEIN